MGRRISSLIVLCCFVMSSVLPNAAYAQAINLPAPGTMVGTSEAYVPIIIKGLTVTPNNPLLFDFIVDTGNSGLKVGKDDVAIKAESEKLVKYFLASLTIPEKDQWVNLSPYEKDRMMTDGLEKTELGRDMLAQDYMLKQVTASLIYPEKDLGKTFWKRVYDRAQKEFGSTEIPVDTFNKVWVVADKAEIYTHNNTVIVVNGHLKVMLESDYVAMSNQKDMAESRAPARDLAANQAQGTGLQAQAASGAQELAKQTIREVVLPELEKEVNTGKNFSQLRQVFYSVILATWYKRNLKEALLTQVYADKTKTNGVERNKAELNPQTIYSKYVEAYKKGVFNLIKEETNASGETTPRKYFSGGEDLILPKGGMVGTTAEKAAGFVESEAIDVNVRVLGADSNEIAVPEGADTIEDLDDIGLHNSAMTAEARWYLVNLINDLRPFSLKIGKRQSIEHLANLILMRAIRRQKVPDALVEEVKKRIQIHIAGRERKYTLIFTVAPGVDNERYPEFLSRALTALQEAIDTTEPAAKSAALKRVRIALMVSGIPQAISLVTKVSDKSDLAKLRGAIESIANEAMTVGAGTATATARPVNDLAWGDARQQLEALRPSEDVAGLGTLGHPEGYNRVTWTVQVARHSGETVFDVPQSFLRKSDRQGAKDTWQPEGTLSLGKRLEMGLEKSGINFENSKFSVSQAGAVVTLTVANAAMAVGGFGLHIDQNSDVTSTLREAVDSQLKSKGLPKGIHQFSNFIVTGKRGNGNTLLWSSDGIQPTDSPLSDYNYDDISFNGQLANLAMTQVKVEAYKPEMGTKIGGTWGQGLLLAHIQGTPGNQQVVVLEVPTTSGGKRNVFLAVLTGSRAAREAVYDIFGKNLGPDFLAQYEAQGRDEFRAGAVRALEKIAQGVVGLSIQALVRYPRGSQLPLVKAEDLVSAVTTKLDGRTLNDFERYEITTPKQASFIRLTQDDFSIEQDGTFVPKSKAAQSWQANGPVDVEFVGVLKADKVNAAMSNVFERQQAYDKILMSLANGSPVGKVELIPDKPVPAIMVWRGLVADTDTGKYRIVYETVSRLAQELGLNVFFDQKNGLGLYLPESAPPATSLSHLAMVLEQNVKDIKTKDVFGAQEDRIEAGGMAKRQLTGEGSRSFTLWSMDGRPLVTWSLSVSKGRVWRGVFSEILEKGTTQEYKGLGYFLREVISTEGNIFYENLGRDPVSLVETSFAIQDLRETTLLPGNTERLEFPLEAPAIRVMAGLTGEKSPVGWMVRRSETSMTIPRGDGTWGLEEVHAKDGSIFLVNTGRNAVKVQTGANQAMKSARKWEVEGTGETIGDALARKLRERQERLDMYSVFSILTVAPDDHIGYYQQKDVVDSSGALLTRPEWQRPFQSLEFFGLLKTESEEFTVASGQTHALGQDYFLLASEVPSAAARSRDYLVTIYRKTAEDVEPQWVSHGTPQEDDFLRSDFDDSLGQYVWVKNIGAGGVTFVRPNRVPSVIATPSTVKGAANEAMTIVLPNNFMELSFDDARAAMLSVVKEAISQNAKWDGPWERAYRGAFQRYVAEHSDSPELTRFVEEVFSGLFEEIHQAEGIKVVHLLDEGIAQARRNAQGETLVDVWLPDLSGSGELRFHQGVRWSDVAPQLIPEIIVEARNAWKAAQVALRRVTIEEGTEVLRDDKIGGKVLRILPPSGSETEGYAVVNWYDYGVSTISLSEARNLRANYAQAASVDGAMTPADLEKAPEEAQGALKDILSEALKVQEKRANFSDEPYADVYVMQYGRDKEHVQDVELGVTYYKSEKITTATLRIGQHFLRVQMQGQRVGSDRNGMDRLQLIAAMIQQGVWGTKEEPPREEIPIINYAMNNLNGGIDMDANKMNMSEKGGKIDMKFDPAMVAQFKRGDFTGIRPVIQSITPITNVRPLLGLAPEAVGAPLANAIGISEAVRREQEV